MNLQFVQKNITRVDRFTMIDALEGATVELDNGEAKVEKGLIYLPQWGPVNLRAYTNEELRNFVRRAKDNERDKSIA